MIKLERLPNSTPPVLTGQRAKNEYANAEKYYREKSPTGFPAYDKFSVYSDDEVKTALWGMSNGKCAYCESQFVNHGVHVEHYRPKGGVQLERSGEAIIGYWWLAAEWSNLLPTCIDCNIEAKHELPDGTVKTVGKGNYFPLTPGCLPAQGAQFLLNELPLLIDPARVNPRRYLKFERREYSGIFLSVVVPATDAPDSRRVSETTIDGYALNRKRLVDSRTRHLLRLERELEGWRARAVLVESLPEGGARIAEKRKLGDALADCLRFYVNRDEAFSAACFDFTLGWLMRNRLPGRLLEMVRKSLDGEARGGTGAVHTATAAGIDAGC
ncbi:hypothetical protein [Burkholderia pyrrocinia]|uniref:hypothetical protein n=1 Tax=Burkholderia pyrrocinia TaxID=60550 RepID=UPI002AB31D1F|nr:hypothetical protein [Burkholderia pyrrocinia]